MASGRENWHLLRKLKGNNQRSPQRARFLLDKEGDGKVQRPFKGHWGLFMMYCDSRTSVFKGDGKTHIKKETFQCLWGFVCQETGDTCE